MYSEGSGCVTRSGRSNPIMLLAESLAYEYLLHAGTSSRRLRRLSCRRLFAAPCSFTVRALSVPRRLLDDAQSISRARLTTSSRVHDKFIGCLFIRLLRSVARLMLKAVSRRRLIA